MITLYFGNVSKRKNSTFVPALTQSVQAVLKDGTSENNPTFLISAQSFSANYCKWDNRYYFIDDIIYERNNLYNVKCVLDVLATYKANILGTTAFVAYDTTENKELTDGRISVETSKTVFQSQAEFNKIGKGSSVILSAVGMDRVNTYVCSETTASLLLSTTTFNSWLDSIDGLPYIAEPTVGDIPEILKLGIDNMTTAFRQLFATGKASDSIKSAFLLPFRMGVIPKGQATTIKLGKFDTLQAGWPIDIATTFNDDISLDIPWPDGVDDWRRNAPYTRLYLYLPFIGAIEIPTCEIIDEDFISILSTISPTSGDIVFQIVAGNRFIMQMSTNVSCPYGIGSSNVSASQSLSNFAMGTVGTVTSLATGGAGGKALGTAGINGIMNNIGGMPSTTGINVGNAVLGLPKIARLYCVYHDTNVTPDSVTATIGTPTMAVKSLGSLSGYVECRNASVSAPAEAVILDQINSLLNNGIFIE